ncbi:UDP-glycosyltransferase UGT5-like [Epargyreus clarus]|uniref:UDP-glycosyltransferase UGT5-like n=1 Tax=Epargyreus clarus TaxID=520877 RepID=UPI003C2BE593
MLERYVDLAKILAIFPTPSISHQVVFRPITHELAKRGHEVVVITTDPAYSKGGAPPNLTEIDIHDVSYKQWKETMIKYGTNKQNDRIYSKVIISIFEKQVITNEVMNLVNKKEKFDLLLTEACVRPALVFSHIFKAPVIQVSSFGSMLGMDSLIGSPTHPLLYPVPLRRRIYNLTMLEKVKELYYHNELNSAYESAISDEDAMLRKVFGPETPSLRELEKNVDLFLFNIHPIWASNQPVPPNVIYVGGIHQNPSQRLPQDLELYLNSSTHGVIYVSFGTNVQTSLLPSDGTSTIAKAFSKLPYDVLWKWDSDELPGRPRNVRISKWLPQSDLLRHPKIKLFITQGGLQSTDEAITAGVPVIGIPMLADQWWNSEKYLLHKIGLKLEFGSFTEEEFASAVNTVIEDKSYRQNIIRLRSIMYDQPQSPLERAIWWIEHVLRHGGAKHLRAPAANMSWTEYYELEIDWLTLLNNSRYGVVYVSFGDNIKPSRLPPKKILILLNVLSEIPYDVLLKWDVDALPGVPKNIKIFKELPQLSVLKHPKIKLFITHGGLQSIHDAINAGVPMIGIPMFGDQWYNTEKYVHFGIGVQVNMELLSEDKLMAALRTVISEESYRRNIVKLRTLMHDQPQTPLERAIWWTEHVLRHGGAKHLRAPAANMSWTEYYELRFIFTLLVLYWVLLGVLIAFLMLGFKIILTIFTDPKKKKS